MLTSMSEIKYYKPVFIPYENETGRLSIAIRSFHQYNSELILSVDPQNLDVTIKSSVVISKKLKNFNDARVKNSTYVRALKQFSSPPYTLKNYGMKSVNSVRQKVCAVLSIDLCPSKKKLDKELFIKTMAEFESKPIPVAIAISGKWLENHRSDFRWLKKLSDDKLFDITWLNHSYNHPYKKGVYDTKNFLLTSGVDFDKEILDTEVMMLKNGITPSIFFRFPGLIADEKLIKKLADFSLIPVGAEAWLAIGQQPKSGSIILVHGNGNEPYGLKLLYDYYNKDALKLITIKHYDARTK